MSKVNSEEANKIIESAPEGLLEIQNNVSGAIDSDWCASQWQSLESAEGNTALEKIDFVGAVSLRAYKEGVSGWRARAAIAIGLDPKGVGVDKMLSTNWGVFRTFRLTGDQGLGFTREEMGTHSTDQLRICSQNHAFLVTHKDIALKILADFTKGNGGAEELRARIKEEEFLITGTVTQRRAKLYHDRIARFSTMEAELFDMLIRMAHHIQLEEDPDYVIPTDPRMAIAAALLVVFSQWSSFPQLVRKNGETVLDEYLQPVYLTPRDRLGEIGLSESSFDECVNAMAMMEGVLNGRTDGRTEDLNGTLEEAS